MTNPLGTLQGSIVDALRKAVADAVPNADVRVTGGGGHFSIEVVSSLFEGKSTLDRQRMVYSAIAPLMKGENAPVHAIDSLVTRPV